MALFPLGMFSDLGKGRQFLLRSESTGPEFRDHWKTLDCSRQVYPLQMRSATSSKQVNSSPRSGSSIFDFAFPWF